LTGESGRGNLKGAAGCWLCCPVVACRGRLSGGFGAGSGAGGIGWDHMCQGEAVTGKGWDVGEGSGMVAVGAVHVGVGAAVATINRVVGVVIVVVADFVAVGGVAGAVELTVAGEGWGLEWESGMIVVGVVGVAINHVVVVIVVGVIVVVIVVGVVAVEGVAVAVVVMWASELAVGAMVHCASGSISRIGAGAAVSWWPRCGAVGVCCGVVGIVVAVAVVVIVVGTVYCCGVGRKASFIASLILCSISMRSW